MVELRPITEDNFLDAFRLTLAPGQEEFVSHPIRSLAQAYVYPETAFPFAVYDGQTIVGFIMMGYYEAKQYYTLWKLLIGWQYQHRGYGRQALEQGIAFLKEKFRDYQNRMNPLLDKEVDKLIELQNKHHEYYQLTLFEHERKLEEKERSVDELFNEFINWVTDTLSIQDNPYIRVVAVFSGVSK